MGLVAREQHEGLELPKLNSEKQSSPVNSTTVPKETHIPFTDPTSASVYHIGDSPMLEMCHRAMNSKSVNVFMAVLTLYALFGGSIRILLFSKDDDPVFTVLSSITFFSFLVELVLRSVFETIIIIEPYHSPLDSESSWSTRFHHYLSRFLCCGRPRRVRVLGYFFSFLFLMDLAAILSLIPEIRFFTRNMTANESFIDNLIMARASRIARVGSRFGRLMRIAQLLRPSFDPAYWFQRLQLATVSCFTRCLRKTDRQFAAAKRVCCSNSRWKSKKRKGRRSGKGKGVTFAETEDSDTDTGSNRSLSRHKAGISSKCSASSSYSSSSPSLSHSSSSSSKKKLQEKEHESQMGIHFRELNTRRLVCITLIMFLATPALMAPDQDHTPTALLAQLHDVNTQRPPGWEDLVHMSKTVYSAFREDDDVLQGDIGHPRLLRLEFLSPLGMPADMKVDLAETYSSLRVGLFDNEIRMLEMTTLDAELYDGTPHGDVTTILWLNERPLRRLESLLIVILVLVAAILLALGSVQISHGAQELLFAPMEAMLHFIHELVRQEFDEDPDTPPSGTTPATTTPAHANSLRAALHPSVTRHPLDPHSDLHFSREAEVRYLQETLDHIVHLPHKGLGLRGSAHLNHSSLHPNHPLPTASFLSQNSPVTQLLHKETERTALMPFQSSLAVLRQVGVKIPCIMMVCRFQHADLVHAALGPRATRLLNTLHGLLQEVIHRHGGYTIACSSGRNDAGNGCVALWELTPPPLHAWKATPKPQDPVPNESGTGEVVRMEDHTTIEVLQSPPSGVGAGALHGLDGLDEDTHFDPTISVHAVDRNNDRSRWPRLFRSSNGHSAGGAGEYSFTRNGPVLDAATAALCETVAENASIAENALLCAMRCLVAIRRNRELNTGSDIAQIRSAIRSLGFRFGLSIAVHAGNTYETPVATTWKSLILYSSELLQQTQSLCDLGTSLGCEVLVSSYVKQMLPTHVRRFWWNLSYAKVRNSLHGPVIHTEPPPSRGTGRRTKPGTDASTSNQLQSHSPHLQPHPSSPALPTKTAAMPRPPVHPSFKHAGGSFGGSIGGSAGTGATPFSVHAKPVSVSPYDPSYVPHPIDLALQHLPAKYRAQLKQNRLFPPVLDAHSPPFKLCTADTWDWHATRSGSILRAVLRAPLSASLYWTRGPSMPTHWALEDGTVAPGATNIASTSSSSDDGGGRRGSKTSHSYGDPIQGGVHTRGVSSSKAPGTSSSGGLRYRGRRGNSNGKGNGNGNGNGISGVRRTSLGADGGQLLDRNGLYAPVTINAGQAIDLLNLARPNTQRSLSARQLTLLAGIEAPSRPRSASNGTPNGGAAAVGGLGLVSPRRRGGIGGGVRGRSGTADEAFPPFGNGNSNGNGNGNGGSRWDASIPPGMYSDGGGGAGSHLASQGSQWETDPFLWAMRLPASVLQGYEAERRSILTKHLDGSETGAVTYQRLHTLAQAVFNALEASGDSATAPGPEIPLPAAVAGIPQFSATTSPKEAGADKYARCLALYDAPLAACYLRFKKLYAQ